MRYRPLRPTRELPCEPDNFALFTRGLIVVGVVAYLLFAWIQP